MAFVIAENVSLHYTVFGSQLLRAALFRVATMGRIRREGAPVIIKALRDVSFEAHAGDRVGVIGRNGAGKTTLLKVIAGIYTPTRGQIRRAGMVSTLITPGLGMETDATGYENIVLAGMTMGLSRSEIDRKIQEIEEFTELGGFLNLPLRTYSAGMWGRLAFAIATSVEPEILVIDEMVSSGDACFIDKASKRITTLISRSRILFLASHSSDVIRKFCNKAMLLESGVLKVFGPVDEVITQYEETWRHPEPLPTSTA